MKKIIVSLLAVVLTACVTVEPKLFAKNVSEEKELQSRLQVASSYLQDNQPEAAMRHLKRAMEINPESPQVHEVLALTLEKMGDEDQVEKHFRQMLRYDSSYTRGRANYGSYLMRQARYEDAYEQFVVVTKDVYYQNRPVAYQQLAICAEKLGKTDEVLPAYKKALAIDNAFVPGLYAMADYYYKHANYPLAQQYLDRYRERVKKSSPSALLLGIRLARVFNDKSEEASYALALKNLYPKSQEYLDYLNMKNN